MLAVRGMRDSDRGLPRTGRGGVADHRRTRRQGPDRENVAELGLPVSATAVAQALRRPARRLCHRHADAASAAELGIPVTMAHTLMRTIEDREALARHVLAIADALAKADA